MKFFFQLFCGMMLFVCCMQDAQAQENTSTDSLKTLLRQPQPDTVHIQLLNRLTELLPDGEWEVYNQQMETFARERLSTARGPLRRFYLGFLASAYNNKSIVYKNTGQTALALKYGEKSLALFRQLNDRQNICVISFNNGKLYHSLGDFGNAISSLQLALKIAQTSRRDLQSYCLNYLGFISTEQGDYEKALEYHRTALQLSRDMKDQEGVGYSIGCIGMVRQRQKKYNEALAAFRQALDVYLALKNDQNIASQYLNIGSACAAQSSYALAQENFAKAYRMMEDMDYAPGMAAVANSMGSNFWNWGKEKEAEKYFLKSLEISRQMGFPRHIHPPAEGLYKIYKKRGDIKKALAMYELSVQMLDSIDNEDVRKKLISSQYRYAYEKKAATDSLKALATERQREMKIERERSRARTQRYLLMGGMALLLLTGFFLFQRFRLRQRLKELAIRNKIASDLHDEVGSALSSISLLSGMAVMQPQAGENAIRKIESTSRETLENMSDIVWSIQPRNDKLSDVVNRMRHYGQQLFHSIGIGFRFEQQDEVAGLPLNMEQRKNLYLIYKEALNNAAKYAGASQLSVSVAYRSKVLTLVIRDDGQGFETGRLREGNGLYTMQQRAQALGGTLHINSSPGSGTIITLRFKTT